MSDPPKSPAPLSAGSRLERALELLAEEARERLARHPSGHLVASRGEPVELTVTLPTSAAAARAGLGELAGEAGAALDRAVSGLVTHQATFVPGAVYCLRCNSAGCEHAAPPGPRQVFAGYGKTGVPRFLDFGQLLLERGDPRVDRLYGNTPALLAHTHVGRDLTADLLDAYRDDEAGYLLHGQVAAGWYRVPDAAGRPAVVALTFQLVSTRPPGNPRRFGLNVLGTGPEGEPLEHLFDRLGELPWSPHVRWAQEALESIERTAAKAGGGRGKRKGTGKKGGKDASGKEERVGRTGVPKSVEKRLTGVLNGLSRRLEKGRRAKERKTRHARERHAQSDRPTEMALADLARAGKEDIMVDRRQETLVVLGDKGRAHVFNPGGKLVTSIRYAPESIERRRKQDRWRPASPDEISTLRGNVKAVGSGA